MRHFQLSQLQSTTLLKQPAYELVSDPSRMQEVILDYLTAAPLLAIDTETTGLDPFTARFLLVQIATSEKCFIFDATRLPSLAPLRPVLENPTCLKFLQNGKFDYKVLKLQAGGIKLANMYDTYLAERVLTCGQSRETSGLTLEALVERYTAQHLDKSVPRTFNPNSLFSRCMRPNYCAFSTTTLLALILLREWLLETDANGQRKYEARVVNTVHDKIIMEVVAAQAEAVRGLVQEEMERAGWGSYFRATCVGGSCM